MDRRKCGETSVHPVRLSASIFVGQTDKADEQRNHIPATAMAREHHLVRCRIQRNPRKLTKRNARRPLASTHRSGACEAFHGKLYIRGACQYSRQIADQMRPPQRFFALRPLQN